MRCRRPWYPSGNLRAHLPSHSSPVADAPYASASETTETCTSANRIRTVSFAPEYCQCAVAPRKMLIFLAKMQVMQACDACDSVVRELSSVEQVVKSLVPG